jgi:hypothetical protein
MISSLLITGVAGVALLVLVFRCAYVAALALSTLLRVTRRRTVALS